MHDSNPVASTYNGHMLRNSGKNCLFICCKQSSSTHFCHFLTTDLEIGGPCGFESLCDGPKNERLPLLGALSIKWWAMRDVACGFAARFRFVASLLACCAGKRFAFPRLCTLSGSNPSAMSPKTKGPHRWEPYQSSGGR